MTHGEVAHGVTVGLETMIFPPSTVLSTKVLLLLFLTNGVLLLPFLWPPHLREIGSCDEAIYIGSGRDIIEGPWPSFAYSPLTGFVYAPCYLLVRSSPCWLQLCCSYGRVVLFVLLWWSSVLVATQLSRWTHPAVMGGLLLASAGPIMALLSYPSDALFVAMAGFSFWQLLTFYHRGHVKHLWASSLFLGLAALSRNDELVLFPIFLSIALVLARRSGNLGHSVAASLLPFATLVGGYLLGYGFLMGDFSLGTQERTYLAFEQGQGVAFEHLYQGNAFVDGQEEARRLFGTPEENGHSVVTAIRRNPTAYLQRVVQIVKKAPKQALAAYGGGTGLILWLLATRGVIGLSRGNAPLVAILLAWLAHLLIYLVTFIRPGYLLLPLFVVFSLAAVGLDRLLSDLHSQKARFLWSITLLVLALLGATTRQPVLVSASLVFLLGFWTLAVTTGFVQDERLSRVVGSLVVLCLALAVGGNFPLPVFRTLGAGPQEEAVFFLREHLPPGSPVGAYAPRDPTAAKMAYVSMMLDLRSLRSDQELAAWITKQELVAIYVDKELRDYEPSLWARVQKLIGTKLTIAFTSSNGEVQVLRPLAFAETPASSR